MIIMFAVCFWGGLRLFIQYTDGKKLYEEYAKIIREIYQS